MRVLTPEAEAELSAFRRWYDDCSCHVSPPCGSCTHPGNPLNQEGDDSCWMEVFDLDEQEARAQAAVARVIELAAVRHLYEMAAGWRQ